MRAAITGATGLVGANLAEALIREGHQVLATRRGSSRTDHVAHLPIRWADADLSDPDALAGAFQSADVVFHCAAAVTIAPRVTPELRAGNVIGTDNVVDAVRRAKVKRLVHCSTVAAAAVSDGTRDVTEDEPWNFPEHGLDDGYATTKYESQQRVLAAARGDVDAVVVQPTFMFGPYDARPSSGEIVVQLARGEIPFSPPGFTNVVDVRDVARGMILAWQRGRRGEKYILGCENVSYREMFGRLARLLGARVPMPAPPQPLLLGAAAIAEGLDAIRGRHGALSRSTIRYAYHRGYRFSSEKARRELGYSPGPVEDGMRACIEWMRAHGVLPH